MPVPDEETFRADVRGWLAASLAGEFAPLVGSGGPGREHQFVPERMAWERLLGANGATPAQRLGLVEDTDPQTLRAVTMEALERWRRLSEHPVYPRAFKDAARTLVRSCEGILFDLQN